MQLARAYQAGKLKQEAARQTDRNLFDAQNPYLQSPILMFAFKAGPAISETTPSRPPIAAEMQNHAKMVQSACGEP